MKEKFLIYGTAILITFLAFIFFQVTGYPRVVTAIETLEIAASPVYMIPIFFPLGILLGELIWLLFNKETLNRFYLLFAQCGILAFLSLIRYIWGFPYSGHTLILAFYIPYQLFSYEKKFLIRIVIGFIVLIITGIYKILIWVDIVTFLLGLAIGFILWTLGYVIQMQIQKKVTSPSLVI